MSDDIWIKHNLGTFQQPYIFQQNRNRQSPTIAQKVAQQPAIARQPSTYVKQSPYSFRAPVNYQQPVIRDAQSPYIANAQSPFIADKQNPFIRDGQTPFTYNYRSPGTYRVSVDAQSPFTYNYRSPGTYRSPVDYRVPFTYNYRSPGTYRNPVIGTAPIIASRPSPYSVSSQSVYVTTDTDVIADNLDGYAETNVSSFTPEVQCYFKVTRSTGTNSATNSNATNYQIGAFMSISGQSGVLSWYEGVLPTSPVLKYRITYSSGGTIYYTGTNIQSKIYEIEDALASDYKVYVEDSVSGIPHPLMASPTLPVYFLGQTPSNPGATVPSGTGGLTATYRVVSPSRFGHNALGNLRFYFVHPTYTDYQVDIQLNLRAQNNGAPLDPLDV